MFIKLQDAAKFISVSNLDSVELCVKDNRVYISTPAYEVKLGTYSEEDVANVVLLQLLSTLEESNLKKSFFSMPTNESATSQYIKHYKKVGPCRYVLIDTPTPADAAEMLNTWYGIVPISKLKRTFDPNDRHKLAVSTEGIYLDGELLPSMN